MEYLDFISKITLYIDGELSLLEKTAFEEALAHNEEYENIFNEIKNNSVLLKELPKVKTKPNFLLELNKKIDIYKSKKESNLFSDLYGFISNPSFKNPKVKVYPAFSVIAMFLIITFSTFKVAQYTKSYNTAYNEEEINNSIAINDSDSLNSVNEDPVLLIGNDR